MTVRLDVSFASGDAQCAAWLYRPTPAATSVRIPCVVMAHGFSLTRHDGLSFYAEALVAAGAAVLVYDHRFLGDSPGLPRQKISINEQLRDRHAAIAYARGLDGIDPNRIVLWGFSMGGMTVVRAAASDQQLGGAIVMFPMIDGRARSITGLRDDPRNAAWTVGRMVAARVNPALQIPVTASPGGRGVLTLPGEAAGFENVVSPESRWQNAVLAKTLSELAMSRPVSGAHRITCPILVQIGDRDMTAPRRAIEKLAERAPRSTLTRYQLDHFDPFVEPHRTTLAHDQAAWLRASV